MKKATRVGTVVALLACFSAYLTAETVTNIRQDINLNVLVPCANDGAGEVVALSGSIHTLITSTINDNRVSGKVHNQPQGISGTGQTTGDKYQGTGVTQSHFTESLVNGQANETFVNNFRIVGQGPGNNFLLHIVAHITFNANGDVTVDHEVTGVECR